MRTDRLAFWVAVGGTAILANFALELATEHIQAPGLKRFVAFTHRGPGQ